MAVAVSFPVTTIRCSVAAAVLVVLCMLYSVALPQARAAAGDDPSPPVPAGVPLLATPLTLDGGMTLQLTTDQRVTLLGEATSRSSVVAAICQLAGIEIRAYAAAEGPYTAKLENVPLDVAFRSILRSESYVLGVRAGDRSAPPRITWIRVLGTESAEMAPAQLARGASSQAMAPAAEAEPPAEAEPAPPKRPFALPAAVLGPAFISQNPDLRYKAQRDLVAALSDPSAVSGFVAMDTGQLVSQIGRFRDPMFALAELESLAENPEVRAKLGEIRGALRELGGTSVRP